MKCGLLFNIRSAWMGAHYSSFNKRLCVNLVPFVTFWVCLEGGNEPKKEYR